jgi:dienelactone hydrolase
MKRILVNTLLILALLLLAGMAGFLVWANTPLGPTLAALAALESSTNVNVSQEPWLFFSPTHQPLKNAGLVLYPGGRVDPRSYAPAAHAIAEAGYLVVIAPMPLNLAVFNPGAASEIMAAYPEIDAWAVGGHSLGGAMAARYAYQNPGAVQGLVLWAAYPASTDDLSGDALEVASIYGSLDGLADPQTVSGSASLLPADTAWTQIEGGNHAQFGWYGAQPGDNPARLSPAEQQAQIVSATLALLERISLTNSD